jgi:hypothetical protein
MYSSIYLKRFRRLLILGAVVAGLTASAVGARIDPGTPPDVAFSLSVAPATVSAQSTTATADVLERYAAAHPYGLAPTSTELVSSPPDVQDAAGALPVTAQGIKADGLRWQGIAQAYQQAETSAGSGGFDWSKYVIGVGGGLGLILLAAGLTMGIRLQRSHRVQSA